MATAGTVEVAEKKLQMAAGDTVRIPDLAPGDYVLKVTYDDGKTESRPVTLEGAKSLSVSFEYQRGALTVSVKTAGTLEVGEKKLPIAAGDILPVKDLAPGDYVLKVTYDDGKTESRPVTVEGGKSLNVSFEYQQGALAVSVKTAGTVAVAGKKLQIAAGDILPVKDLAPGDYVLKVTYDDGKTESRPVTVEGGKSLNVSFEYQRGALTVSVATAGTVEVAGKKLQIAAGDTTIVSDLSPGDYVLKVTYDDGNTESGAVTVEGGKRAQVSFAYKPGATEPSEKSQTPSAGAGSGWSARQAKDFLELVKTGAPQEVQAIINIGADLNARDNDGSTPLMYAAEFNGPDVITTLLKAGADVNAQDNNGVTALMVAAQFNQNPGAATVLLKAGADLKTEDKFLSLTPLGHAASYNKNPEVINVLLEAGADINALNGGWTALMLAAKDNQNPEVIMTLLKAGANAKAKDWLGRTAFFFAHGNGKLKGTVAYKALEKASQ